MRWLFELVDHHDLHRAAAGFQLEPELLLQSAERLGASGSMAGAGAPGSDHGPVGRDPALGGELECQVERLVSPVLSITGRPVRSASVVTNCAMLRAMVPDRERHEARESKESFGQRRTSLPRCDWGVSAVAAVFPR